MGKYKWDFSNNTSGVYKVTNKITGECYIGASKNIRIRWRNHFTNYNNSKRKDYNSLLYKNIRAYGIENFVFELIEQCPLSELNKKERYYVKIFNPAYNQTPGGKGGHVNRPERFWEIIYDLKNTKINLKKLAKKYGCCEDTISAINQGKNWRDDSLKYPVRPFNKLEHCAINLGVPVIQLEMNGNFVKEWRCISEFLRINHMDVKGSTHISAVCRGKRKSAYGYIWKYKEDYEKNKA